MVSESPSHRQTSSITAHPLKLRTKKKSKLGEPGPQSNLRHRRKRSHL